MPSSRKRVSKFPLPRTITAPGSLIVGRATPGSACTLRIASPPVPGRLSTSRAESVWRVISVSGRRP